MSCLVSEELLALYVSGDVSPEQNDSVSDHLSRCERCRLTLADLHCSIRFLAATSAEPDEEDLRDVRGAVMQQIRDTRRRSRLPEAAAIAAGVAVLIALPFEARKSQRERHSATVASLPALLSLPVRTLKLPAEVRLGPVRQRKRKQNVESGFRVIALNTGPNGKPQLKIATADPNVIILFQLDDNTHAN